MGSYRLTYASELASEEKFLDDLARILAGEGIDARLGQGMTLTLSEAFTNALVHGNHLNRAKRIIVDIRVNESGVEADITDEGYGGLERIAHRRPAGLLADHGRGISLMRHYAGGVDFAETAAGGLKVSMTFDRKRERIGK